MSLPVLKLTSHHTMHAVLWLFRKYKHSNVHNMAAVAYPPIISDVLEDQNQLCTLKPTCKHISSPKPSLS